MIPANRMGGRQHRSDHAHYLVLTLQQQFTRIVEEVDRIRGRQVESGKEIEVLCGGLVQRAFAGELSTGNV